MQSRLDPRRPFHAPPLRRPATSVLIAATLLIGPIAAFANQPPTCRDDFFTTETGSSLVIRWEHLLESDADPDSDPIAVSGFDISSTQGTLQLHIPGFTYLPPSGYVGSDSFDYEIADSLGATAVCTASIEVTPAPTLHAADGFSGAGFLDGRPTESGSETWIARRGAIVTGGYTRDSPLIAGLPFTLSQVLATDTVALTALVNPAKSEWTAVGYSNAKGTAYTTAGQLWVLLTDSNTYEVHALGQLLASGTVPGTASGGYDAVDIRYRASDRRAEARLNGTLVHASNLTAVPDIQWVGLHMLNASEVGPKIDDFDLRVAGTATPILRDTFSSDGTLNNRVPDVGGSTWYSRRAGLVTGGKVVDSTASASVPFDVATLPGTPTVRLDAKIDASGPGAIEVGFGSQPAGRFYPFGRFWLDLRPGDLYLIVDSGGFTLQSGIVPGTPAGGYHQLRMEIDTAANVGTLWLNGYPIYQGSGGFSPIEYAGFHMHQPTVDDRIDDFQVSWWP